MENMGIGKLGAPNLILKRKFRFTLEISTPCGNIPKHYVKVAARPQLEIEEQELNFLNAVTWVPGKGRWQPMSVTYIDVPDAEMVGLYKWMATVYDFTEPVTLRQAEKVSWAGQANLIMYDGCGNPLERWLLKSVWPQSINFGDLDYSNSEEATIELTLRYSEVAYQSLCGWTNNPGERFGCCDGCGTSTSVNV